jgi:hypothetical protein
MKPPAPVSGEISAETVRMPDGIAAMKRSVGLDQPGRGSGSPAMNGARAIEPTTSLAASGRSLRRTKLLLRRRRRPALPLHILRLDGLAKADVGLHEHIHRLHCATGSGGEACRFHWDMGNAAGTGSDSQATMRAVFTLHFPHYAATLRSVAVMGVDQLFVKAWLMRRI